ncbi:ras GEF [Nadsonia fulvescens var. elongata DSM 6958]|uniref:Ras GEF n=1 Tax=Nadsonia fulvescens var. elongata DSM 6958 TaxID=857566 RepID=A0A1E3PDZ2_9ASCO|nr:ras GEF [Nadsonia fulvescens var. elongata DSM 6958]
MTLIERDALAEVDWKELIELRWDQKFDPIQSWLSFLINHRIRGIELVISRFNLMVNWVISEILLTRSQADRERVISKFIHVAARARQYQNFATMMQIVLALSSGKIQCLSRTWKQVSRENMTLLTELERLVIPFKNFQNLRAELNALNPAVGCIPFVGLYLSDLTFNAERPSHVTRTDKGKKPHTETAKTSMSFTTRNSETARSSSVSSARSADSTSTTTSIPSTASEESLASTTLINFDRFRTSASIVRSLIQCIEWSKHYTFEPNDDIVAKCLYICSLTSDEMEKCHEYLIDP